MSGSGQPSPPTLCRSWLAQVAPPTEKVLAGFSNSTLSLRSSRHCCCRFCVLEPQPSLREALAERGIRTVVYLLRPRLEALQAAVAHVRMLQAGPRCGGRLRSPWFVVRLRVAELRGVELCVACALTVETSMPAARRRPGAAPPPPPRRARWSFRCC